MATSRTRIAIPHSRSPTQLLAAKAVSAEPQTVYLNGTSYYHRKECKRLEANPKAVHAESLDAAGKTHWPCPDCKPPVRKRTPASQPLGRVR